MPKCDDINEGRIKVYSNSVPILEKTSVILSTQHISLNISLLISELNIGTICDKIQD